MTWATHLRTLAAALGAFVIFCALVTQLLARALGYAPELGEGLIEMGGAHLYAPFSFLAWSIAWARFAPSLLVLSILIALVCALAAYAVAVVLAKLEPLRLAPASPWRDLASWRELGHYGLLRDDGLALGAVRRHALAPYKFVRRASGGCAFVGEARHTDGAFLGALAAWPGALVLIAARSEIADRLGRADVLRFAPGRHDTLCFNPLLAIRGGAHAWSDARRLACALLSADRTGGEIIDALALVMLDQLLCAPVEARTLADLRRRLIEPTPLVADLCGRWTGAPGADAAPAIWEMARAVRALRAAPDEAVAHYARIDNVVTAFAEPVLANATSAHHLNLAHLVSAAPPCVLALSMEETSGAHTALLIQGVLAQLAALHASAGAAQDLMVAVEAEAVRVLAEHAKQQLPVSPRARVVVQAGDISHAQRLAGETDSLGAVVAIGPQREPSAAALSSLGGQCMTFEPIPHRIPRWRDLLFPAWVARQAERLPVEALKGAGADQAFLVAADQKPVRMNVLVGGGASSYVTTAQPAAHDWSAPPLDHAASAPDSLENPAPAAAATGPGSARLRRVLTRKSAPPAAKGSPAP